MSAEIACLRHIPQRRSLGELFSVYSRLGNFKVYIQWLPVLIGWSLIASPFGVSAGEAVAVLLLMGAAMSVPPAAGHWITCRATATGSTSRPTAPTMSSAATRPRATPTTKPLVTGEITDPEARRFGIGIGVLSVILGTGAVLLSPDAPLWLVPVWGLWVLISSQYAYGIKISYWGPAELLLGVEIGALVALPVIMLKGGLTTEAAFISYLIGTLFSQVTLFSMIYDRDADASAGRLTLAVRFSPLQYRVILGLLDLRRLGGRRRRLRQRRARSVAAGRLAARLGDAGRPAALRRLQHRRADRPPARLARLHRRVRQLHHREPDPR